MLPDKGNDWDFAEGCQTPYEQVANIYQHRNAQIAKTSAAGEQLGDMVAAVIGQPYCSSCHRGRMHLGSQVTLESCKTCRLVSTCNDCVTTHTAEECQYYCLIGELEEYKLRHFEAHTTISASVTPTKPKTSRARQPLSAIHGWLDYYRWISDKRNISAFIAADFSFDPGELESDAARNQWRHLLLATDSLTMPLTILAALEDSVPDLPKAGTLTLHIVGAAGKEFRSLKLFEEVLHMLPTVAHLKVVLVGPEAPGASAGQTGGLDQDIELDCCSTCISNDRRRTVTSFQGGYHEYATKPAYTKPDLAVLFHSGRSQANVEEWKPTTHFLVDSGTRTLCTTYTEREAREETAELDELGVRFVRRPQINKWQGLAPLPELLEGPEHGAYYNNYYRYIFQGRRV